MSIANFNRGRNDAYAGRFRERFADDPDYREGFSFGESIKKRIEELGKEWQVKRQRIWNEYKKLWDESRGLRL